jgi:hypothetical protein
VTVVRRTTLVTWASGSTEEARSRVVAGLERTGAAPGVIESWVRPTMPGTVRGGDLVWHVAWDGDHALAGWSASHAGQEASVALADAVVDASTSVTYDEGRTGTRPVVGERAVHRTLLLRAVADDDTLARFEDELFAMGETIPVMRLWRLSRVRGPKPDGWTHVWEQVFADPVGLERAYMRHPYHWGRVDRWFDGESPERVVLPTFCHTFCLLA